VARVLRDTGPRGWRRGWAVVSGQLRMEFVRGHLPGRLIAAAYGGGVNTIAAQIWMKRNGYRPHVTVMSNPGSERAGTETYRDGVFAEWCDSVGFPRVTVISRISEGEFRPKAWRLETLKDECQRIGALPSVAYGFKKCSLKYKAQPQRWWFDRQEWARAEWAANRKITRLIGYDAGELPRVQPSFVDPWELARFVPWYPLVDEGFDRDGCCDLILSEGLPLPPKSACKWCPNNTVAEWREYERDEPADFRQTVDWSRAAANNITAPDVVGFLRRAPNGKRQLHEWFDAGMPKIDGADDEIEDTDMMPCECAQ
jgi:hypothetical protein